LCLKLGSCSAAGEGLRAAWRVAAWGAAAGGGGSALVVSVASQGLTSAPGL
jgi:hypothetical protein